ncbi:RagB/SusD family nutrient uptake outer membrane protein [Saccharicrinis fermentans]|uniref:SusD family protein n=1 Tax=Saccharicrinis fermentans DSM 9555 = JCM 21142 TaxID=869213 RepID=W7Y3P9_9BACT|nr:RagB/SusD family nutrient uptake outer membrane protein [Saccharicrinis fermentans]GAF05500.1 SusD family protein [Saccharicrinis fermentans DSM 9555 = JCM 21142]
MIHIIFRYIGFLLVVGFLFSSCTDLEEEVIDEIISADINDVKQSGEKLLAATYDKGEGIFCNYSGIWCLQQMTTDETVLPVRGEDWRDGGNWKTLHEFTWDAYSVKPEGNWNNLNGAIAQALTTIDVLENSEEANRDMFLAEARCLWALYTYYLADLFGQVPYRDPANIDFAVLPDILTAEEAVNKCIAIVEICIPDLVALGDNGTHAGRFTKEGAYALLAHMYLNKAVYDDRYNESSAFEFTTTKYMDSVIFYCDKIISGASFSLEDDYFQIFDVDNQYNKEHIFSIIQVATGDNRGQNDFTYLAMGRNQKANPDNNRGSNATCTTPEYYALWDNNRSDPRFRKYTLKNGGEVFKNDGTDYSLPYDGVFHFNRGFQEGQQYGPIITDGAFEMDPSDASRVLVQQLYTEKTPDLLMDFTRELHFDAAYDAAFTQNQINRGVRIFKHEYDAENTRSNGGVDIPVFRLGQVYTMRAEAKFRNGDVSGALDDINLLRSSRWSVDIDGHPFYGQTLSVLTEEILYNEISYELYWEAQRRQEMIRFGKFEEAYTAKPASEPFRRVFAIPQSELDVNVDLRQNKGYD